MGNIIGDFIEDLLRKFIFMAYKNIFNNFTDAINDNLQIIKIDPALYDAGLFNTLKQISKDAMLPIAVMVVTFWFCSEFIKIGIEKNNMQHFGIEIFFSILIKFIIIVALVRNSFSIISAIFEIANIVIDKAVGVFNTSITISVSNDKLDAFKTSLETLDIGALSVLSIEMLLLMIATILARFYIYYICYARMVEIYITIVFAPIPLSTIFTSSWSNAQTYIKKVFTLGLQGFVMILVIAIYKILIDKVLMLQNDALLNMFISVAITMVLAGMLGKSQTIAGYILGDR